MDHQASNHFGAFADTSIFTPQTLSSKGDLRCCVGSSGKSKVWYGIIKNEKYANPNYIAFCEFCTKNVINFVEQTYPITEEDYPGLSKRLRCDTLKSRKCIDFIGNDFRTLRHGGIKFNVNITDEDDKEWSPITKLQTDYAIEAAKTGVLLANIPTMNHWEFVVKGDDAIQVGLDITNKINYYTTEHYFKVEAKDGTGRSIVIEDTNGNSNFYTPMIGGEVRVNSYKPGTGNRFFFQAPAIEGEVNAGIAASHNNESNKIFLKIGIYEKIETREVLSAGPKWRGGGSSNNLFTGGSNFATSGTSTTFSTIKTSAKFILRKTVHGIIQLINNESEEERLYMARKLQTQVDNSERDSIEAFNSNSRQKKFVQRSNRSKMLSMLI